MERSRRWRNASSTCCACGRSRTRRAASRRSSPGVFSPQHTELGGVEATGIDYLRTLALARIVLDNFDNLQASWVTQGGKVGQLSLAYGANDMGSVMIEENVVRAAGAAYCMDEIEIVRNVEDAGFDSQTPEHALRDPRRSDLPRTGRSADAEPCERESRRGVRRRARGSTVSRTKPHWQGCATAGFLESRSMPHYRAAWLLPISEPPIRDAWFHLDAGRIVSFGRGRERRARQSEEIDLGDVAVLPGLVNAHTHLELSWMRGRVSTGDEFPDWIRSVMSLRRAEGADDAKAIVAAIDEARAFGTTLIGDISNTLASPAILASKGMAAVVFHELFGFRSQDAKRIVADAAHRLSNVDGGAAVRCTLAPHAPYSVSAALFRAIHRQVDGSSCRLSSVHLGESRQKWNSFETAAVSSARCSRMSAHGTTGGRPRAAIPWRTCEDLGVLHEHLLVVHGVQFGPGELRRFAGQGCDARHLPAWQHPDGCRRSLRSLPSSSLASTSPSAPTASPACPT